MKTKNYALAVVAMVLFSAFYFSSCSSDLSAPDAASTLTKIKGASVLTSDSLLLKDSLVADSLHHHGKKPHCDSTFVKHPKPAFDSTFVKPPKPHRDSTFVKPPKPVFDPLPNDSAKSHRPNTFKPKGRK